MALQRPDDPELERRAATATVAMLAAIGSLLLNGVLFWPLEDSHVSSYSLLLSAGATSALLVLCRAGHVDTAVGLFAVVLWLEVVGTPVITGDMSANPLIVAPISMLLVAILPRWPALWAGVWAGTALLALLLGTTDTATIELPREVWILTSGIVAFSAVAIMAFAAKQFIVAWQRQDAMEHVVADQARSAQRLRTAVNTDALTGLGNRNALEVRCQQHPSGDFDPTAVVVMIDLDDFKAVNDELSHAHGDAVLRHLAAAMRQESRSTDELFRVGGDEFMVILPSGGAGAAREWLERLALRLAVNRGDLPTVTVSAGVASCAAALRPAIEQADQALLAAKRSGRPVVEAG